MHGIEYQLKLLMLFLKRGFDNGYTFKLATEMDAAQKFDDIVFMYEINGRRIGRFLQAKHLRSEEERIKTNDLLTDADEKFSLQKYFHSYREIKKHNYFKDVIIKDFIICTNIDFDFESENSDLFKLKNGNLFFEAISENDDILNVGGQRYKFVSYKYEDKRSSTFALLKSILIKTSDLSQLAKLLAEYLFGMKDKYGKSATINLHEKLFKKYQGALCEEIIDLQTRKIKDEFLNDSDKLSNNTKSFRRVFLEEVKRCIGSRDIIFNESQIPESTVAAVLECPQTKVPKTVESKSSTAREVFLYQMLKDIKLSKNFERYVKIEPEPNLIEVEKFSVDLAASIKSKVSNNSVQLIRKNLIGKNIDKLAGHIFVRKGNEIYFNTKFFEMKMKLPGNLNNFRKRFITELNELGMDFNLLKEYTFEITNYKTCLEEEVEQLLNSKYTLPDDSISDEEISEFLDKIIFFVNQPKEQELGNLLNREIGAELSFLSSEIFTYDFEEKIWNWMKDKEGKYLSKIDAEEFFSEMKKIISRFIMLGPTCEFCIKMTNMGVYFKKLNDELIKFLKSEKKFILNFVVNSDTIFGAIKVYQILQKGINSDYMKKDGSIFVNTNTLLRLKNYIIEALKSKSNNKILVIECCETSGIEPSDISNCIKSLLDIESKNLKIVLIINKEFSIKIIKESVDKYSYCVIDELETNFDSLTTESQEKLLKESMIIFQGRKIPLSSLVKANKFPENSIDEKALSLLVRKKNLVIGDVLYELSDVKNYYIEREFHRRNIIDEQLLNSVDPSVYFTFSDMNLKSLKELFPKEQIITSKNLLYEGFMLTKVILLDENEAVKHFERICQKWQKIIYWLRKINNKIILHRSHGSLSGIRQIMNKRLMNRYQCKKISDFDEKFLIISADPGMGKSTLLTYMAEQEKIVKPYIWIIRIDLVNMVDEFKKYDDFEVIQLIEVITLNAEHKYFESNILKYKIFFEGNIYFLFDGFDEISPQYTLKVLMLLNKLKETKIDKIVITTRPHLKKELEKRFNTISYELSTFNEENQEVFLKKYWKRNLKFDVVDDEKLKLFSTHILSLISFSLRDKERKLMGIPLQTRMLAEVYEDDFKNFHQTKVKKHNLPNSLNSLELYRIFINKKYEIYLKEKLGLKLEIPGGEETQRTLKYSFDEQHKFIAMKVIFDNTKLMPEKNNFDEVSLLRVGIVEKLNGKATFIHRTFAEYFAIDWMAENLNRNDVKKILAERIFNDHGEVMRNFFDRKLAIRNKMIIATLNNDEVTLKALLKKPLQKNLKKNKRTAQGQPTEDQQGRTALHLAASYGFDNIVNLLISNDAKINAVDNLFSWTPLKYAANACEWGTVNLLLNKGANYSDLENINFFKSKIQEKTALHIASFSNYQVLAGAIFKIYEFNDNQLEEIIFARDEFGQICLHFAVQG
jgi:hypothetical protein